MQKLRTKRLPYLDRFEIHMDYNTKMSAKVPIYKLRTVEIDENGGIIETKNA